MEENKNEVAVGKTSLLNKIIIGAIILVVIFLIIFFWPKKIVAPADEVTVVDATAETNNGALRVIQPIMSGDYKYEFTGVKWTFDTTSPEIAGTNQTWIKMEFADFTRNGNAIAFGTPYKLGVHAGVCKEIDFIETLPEDGIPFSYAECKGNGVTRDFVVLQKEEQIVVRMKEIKSGSEPVWKDWYKIDVTDIVR
jgi:hypothetical protein